MDGIFSKYCEFRERTFQDGSAEATIIRIFAFWCVWCVLLGIIGVVLMLPQHFAFREYHAGGGGIVVLLVSCTVCAMGSSSVLKASIVAGFWLWLGLYFNVGSLRSVDTYEWCFGILIVLFSLRYALWRSWLFDWGRG